MNAENFRLMARGYVVPTVALMALLCCFQAAAQPCGGAGSAGNGAQQGIRVPAGTILLL